MKLCPLRGSDTPNVPMTELQKVLHGQIGVSPVIVNQHIHVRNLLLPGMIKGTEQQQRETLLRNSTDEIRRTSAAENQSATPLFQLSGFKLKFFAHLPQLHVEIISAENRLQSEQEPKPVLAIWIDLVEHNPDRASSFLSSRCFHGTFVNNKGSVMRTAGQPALLYENGDAVSTVIELNPEIL